GRYVHRVRLADAAGTPLAPERAIAVELRSEEAVRCSDIAGRVHLEKDGSGIEGVRIRLDNGHSVRTDATGRFRFACTAIPGGRPGTEVRLFLDLDSLPADMRLNGATPRIVTLAESGEVTVNFTAVTLRVIRLDISGEAFTGDGDTLEPRWLEGVERLVGLLSEEASILRISYRTNRESPAMIRQRLAALSDLVHERWRQIGNPYPLEIRNEILN